MSNKLSTPISITLPSLDQKPTTATNESNAGPLSAKTTNETYTIINKKFNSKEIKAARIIENAWCKYRDVQMFRLLKHAVCAAEHSLSNEVLKKISPNEANLLNDPCLNVKVKFRFGGEEFPPVILFKVYTQSIQKNATKYMSGKKVIQPASTAAREACDQMGNRMFYHQIIVDALQNKKGGVYHETDVVTLKDYMQYSSLLDELPARLGGRANTWRRLNLENLPRHNILYDVVNYATSQKMSQRLLKELPVLLQKPSTQSIQLKHLEILSKISSPDPSSVNQSTMYSSSQFKVSEPRISSRRSKNAIQKVAKMKKAYTFARSETLTTEADVLPSASNRTYSMKEEIQEINAEFEDQANDLYLWTQNLSINDDYLKSPRLPTH